MTDYCQEITGFIRRHGPEVPMEPERLTLEDLQEMIDEQMSHRFDPPRR